MAKTNASFNLSKPVRRVMGTILNREQRTVYKQAMIDAEHSYTVNRHRKPRETTATREVPGDN